MSFEREHRCRREVEVEREVDMEIIILYYYYHIYIIIIIVVVMIMINSMMITYFQVWMYQANKNKDANSHLTQYNSVLVPALMIKISTCI